MRLDSIRALSLLLLPVLAALLGTPARAQTPTKTVRSFYVVPSDAAQSNRQALCFNAVVENQQKWAQYGATFVAEPIETIVSSHDTSWFLLNPDGIHNSTDWNWLGNSANEIVAHTDIQFNDPDHRMIIFLEVDVGGFCPCAAAANFGFAGMPKWIIDRIQSGFAPEVGAIGHELGHTFGMPHEDCAAQCEPRGVMCNGTSTDACGQTTSYPDVALFAWHYNYLFQPQFVEYFVESTSNCIFDLAQVADTEDEAGPYVVDVAYNPAGGAPGNTVTLFYRVGGGPWLSSPMSALGGGNYRGEIPGQSSIQNVEYYVEGQTSGFVHTYPVGGSANARSFVVAHKELSFTDEFETQLNWTVADTAVTSGSWVRVDPLGTFAGSSPVAPDDDATAGGTHCYVTGQGTGGPTSEADLDGGPTVLTSPAILLGQRDAIISFRYWFESDTDSLLLEAARTGQASAVYVPIRVFTDADNRSCTTPGDEPAWRAFSFRVGKYFNPGGATRLRFSVSDNPNDSITEAAIDDVRVHKLFEVEDPCDMISPYCFAIANSTGAAAAIATQGSTSVAANDLSLSVAGIPDNTGIFITSPDTASMPLGNGNLCVGSTTLGFVRRLLPGYLGVNNSASVALDHTDTAVPVLQVTPGSTWNYQAWFRDVVGAGFNFSNAVSVTYCP